MAEAVVRRCQPLLGTLVEVAVPVSCAADIGAAFAAVRHVHERLSFHEETSDLAALRRAPAGQAVRVDPATTTVLAAALEFSRMSGGIFDVSIGYDLVAAGFLPRPPGVDLRRMTGTTANLEVIDDRRVVCHKPMLIDLGGIAKGYAVDRAVQALASRGVPGGIVNAGGDLRTFGPAKQIIHLRGADGAMDGIVALTESAIASSGNRHVRRTVRRRETSPHLRGRGCSVLASEAVTVIAPTCMAADAMTKIALAAPSMARLLSKRLGGSVVERPGQRVV